MKVEAILTPAELPSMAKRDLRATACVVFDVLRATSTIATALNNGATEIIPVAEIPEAIALRRNRPEILLGGERHGVKIHADGVDFDFGNSPREYAAEKVAGKTIVSTTTNGTRALRACAGAKAILAASILNLAATARFLRQKNCESILLVCAGTRENAALEDILAAGALAELLGKEYALSDSAQIALHAYTDAKLNLKEAIFSSENARRVRSIPELLGDVEFCLQRDKYNFAVELQRDGALRKV